MSVLKNKRNTSIMQFVVTANKLFVETISFLSRLSARYARIIGDQTAEIAGEMLNQVVEANAIYPSDEQRYTLRREHLLEAVALLNALDVRLNQVYQILCKNPQGAFSTNSGKVIQSNEAYKKLDKMCESIGCLIDEEEKLLSGVLSKDKKKRKNK